jgi:hypothetical protein
MLIRNSGCRYMEFLWNGYKCLFLENELIRVEILVDKGTDIVEFLYKPFDIDFMWRSPIPFISSVKINSNSTSKNWKFY